MMLKQPLDIALIGTGFRSKTVYRSLVAALRRRGVRLVVVCDPVHESADAYAASMGVSALALTFEVEGMLNRPIPRG